MYLMVQPLSGGGARPGSCPVAITWREVSCRVAKPLAMRAGCWPAGRVSSTGSVGVVDRTFCLCRGGFELDDEFEEAVNESGVIVLGIGTRELDHLAVAVGGLAELAAALVDHAETIVAIVHLGVAKQQLSGGLFGLIEAAGMDQV